MIAALLAAVFAAGTGGPVDDRAPLAGAATSWRERQIEWTLAGAGKGARSIVVQPGIWGGCDQGPPKVRVTESETEIAVEAVVLEPEGVESMICPAIAGLSEPERVRLEAPVGGRRVVGPQRIVRPGAAIPQVPGAVPAVPRVVGLAASDARGVLCGWRVRARGARGDAVVTAQRPAAGTPLELPATAAPERCAELPAKPAARLLAR
ncbi:MAG TPA: hypothetical protein VFR97_04560 [Capillimicrobium sp.]|nr:hypothetical protein [Capillimicrobium sp.]